ncbi:hypothetical protein LINPERHAP2_LOCUS13183 [Linum perenne]
MDSVSQQSDDCVEIGGSLVWPAVIENFLLDTMLEEMKKGHLVSATFSKTGWQRIINALKDKFNKLYTQKQLVNKYGVMKTRYSNFKNLLSHTGMGYNEITGQLTADEEVWRLAKVCLSFQPHPFVLTHMYMQLHNMYFMCLTGYEQRCGPI